MSRIPFGKFKSRDADSTFCGPQDANHRPFANKFDNDKKDNGTPRYEHMKASTVAADTPDRSCFGHNIQLEDGTTIDPHIIIGGTGLSELELMQKLIELSDEKAKKHAPKSSVSWPNAADKSGSVVLSFHSISGAILNKS